MNIGFFDPISERWIKPRPEKEPDPVPTVSMGEALLNAIAAKVEQDRCAKIWEYLKQSAEGCNSLPVSDSPSAPVIAEVPADYEPELSPGYILYQSPAEYVAVESLGYVYWKPKEETT